MKANPFLIALIASAVLTSPVLAQETTKAANDVKMETSDKTKHSKREPIDLKKFSNVDDLKAADTDKDGFLSRVEIEAYVQAQMIKRAADRMERRLDVNKDGKISIDAIEKHRGEKFAELDKNKDGKLDRSELKAAKDHHKSEWKHKGKHHKDSDHKKD